MFESAALGVHKAVSLIDITKVEFGPGWTSQIRPSYNRCLSIHGASIFYKQPKSLYYILKLNLYLIGQTWTSHIRPSRSRCMGKYFL